MTRLIYDRKLDLLWIIPDDNAKDEHDSVLVRIDLRMREIAFANVVVDTRSLASSDQMNDLMHLLKRVATRSFGKFAIIMESQFHPLFDDVMATFPYGTTVKLFSQPRQIGHWLNTTE